MASVNIKNPPESQFLTMNDFYANSAKYNGLAKSARFLVRILPSAFMASSGGFMKDLTYLCEAAEFPGRGFMTTEARYYGPSFKTPYQTTYEDLNLTFICRDKFLERQLFDTWLESINPTSTYNFSYRDQYCTTIEIYQMSDLGTSPDNPAPYAQYKFTFEKAWPILINPQPVTWADDNFHRLTVSFSYTRWRREELDPKAPPSYDLVAGRENITDGTTVPTFNTEFSGKRITTQTTVVDLFVDLKNEVKSWFGW